jgi:outer membrane immunogenic protein
VKRILLGAVALALIAIGAASALAADLPVRTYTKSAVAVSPVYNWSGLYVGGSVGGHVGNDSDPAALLNNSWFGSADAAIVSPAFPNTRKPSGFAGGGQVGYNWQAQSFVYGVEAGIFGLSGTSSRNLAIPLTNQQVSTVGDSANDRGIATLRARAGLAFDRVLMYAAGGAAFSNWSLSHSYSDTVGAIPTTVTSSPTRAGWTVGAGLEYGVTNNWTLRGEYLYANFGTSNNSLAMFVGGIGGFTIQYPEKLTENIGLLGLNYKF